MKLVIIIGSGAVGKMTVGQALMQQTGLRLFHNHMMIELVIEIFGRYDSRIVTELREVIFREFAQSDLEGMIFTYMWAFDHPSDWDYIEGVSRLFETNGGEVYWVELIAPQSVRLERNRTDNRLHNKPSKRDLQFSDNNIRREDDNYRLVSYEGEIPFKNYLRIDNSSLEPDKVAAMIREKFSL